MTAAWLAYVLVVSALVGLSALAGERAARAQGWAGRWVWATGLVLSVALPVVAWLVPDRPAATTLPRFAGAYVLEGFTASPGGADQGLPLSTVVIGLWAAATVLLLAFMAGAALRLWRRRRAWPTREVDGVEVLVSRSTGPAAMGLVRGRVVVPEWALSLDPPERRLLVLHESEHVRARDPLLAVGGLLLCALVPWNALMWWQLRRLRLALEMDCDARVLRRSGDARRYGSLLLQVGQHRAALALCLAEPKSMLERRIRMITQTTTGRRTFRALALAALAGLGLALACEAPDPSPVAPDEAGRSMTAEQAESSQRVQGDAQTAEEAPCNPAFVVDGERVAASSGAELDRTLDQSSIASIHVIKPTGEQASSDRAGCGTVLVLTRDASEAEQAKTREIEATLKPVGSSSPEPTKRSTLTRLKEGDQPTFTPMTARPELRNAKQVQQALTSYYPPLLRDAGIGGTANVWFFIDETGRVVKTMINKSSGHEALDMAALKVAKTMEFTPALNRDKTVPVWVALDIKFAVQ